MHEINVASRLMNLEGRQVETRKPFEVLKKGCCAKEEEEEEEGQGGVPFVDESVAAFWTALSSFAANWEDKRRQERRSRY